MKKTSGSDRRTILLVDGELAQPSEDDVGQRRQVFEDFRQKIDELSQSYAEKFDKLILGYSSSGLAISVSLFKDFFLSSSTLGFPVLLCVSWLSFTLAILMVAVSYRMNQKSAIERLVAAERMLIHFDEDAYFRTGPWTKATDWATSVAAMLFFVGVVATITFPIVTKIPLHPALDTPRAGPLKIGATHLSI